MVQVVQRGTPVTKTVVQLGDQTLKYQVEIKPLWPTNFKFVIKRLEKYLSEFGHILQS